MYAHMCDVYTHESMLLSVKRTKLQIKKKLKSPYKQEKKINKTIYKENNYFCVIILDSWKVGQ